MTSSALEGKPKKLTLTVDLTEGTKRLPCPCCGQDSRIHDHRSAAGGTATSRSFADLDSGRLLYITEGRDAAAVESHADGALGDC